MMTARWSSATRTRRTLFSPTRRITRPSPCARNRRRREKLSRGKRHRHRDHRGRQGRLHRTAVQRGAHRHRPRRKACAAIPPTTCRRPSLWKPASPCSAAVHQDARRSKLTRAPANTWNAREPLNVEFRIQETESKPATRGFFYFPDKLCFQTICFGQSLADARSERQRRTSVARHTGVQRVCRGKILLIGKPQAGVARRQMPTRKSPANSTALASHSSRPATKSSKSSGRSSPASARTREIFLTPTSSC